MHIERTTYLSLGSNLGKRLDYLQQSVDLISEKIGRVVRISSVYETDSWGFESDKFLNCCIQVATAKNPEDLLQLIHEIEEALGALQSIRKGFSGQIY